MSTTLTSLGIDRMTVEDRIALIGEIWDSIAADPEKIPLSDAQKQEIDRRLAAFEADASKLTPWEIIKADALVRMKQ